MENATSPYRELAPGEPYAAHGSVSPKSTVASLRPGHEPAPVQPPYLPGSIGACCVDFMLKINTTFGEHSQQRAIILQTLHDFKTGQLSKRRAHITMSQVLDAHPDLQDNLLDILDHPEARWGPGDFRFSQTVNTTPVQATQTLPEYMEPQRQPQFPMAYTCSEWNSTPHSEPAHPTSSFGNPPSLPSLSMPQMNNRDVFHVTHHVTHHGENYGQGGYDYYGNGPQLQPAYVQDENSHWNSLPQSELSCSVPSMPNELPSDYMTPLGRDESQHASYARFIQPTEFNPPNYDDANQGDALYGSNSTWSENNVGAIHEGTYHHHSIQSLVPEEIRMDHSTPTPHTPEALQSGLSYTVLEPMAAHRHNNGMDQMIEYADPSATDPTGSHYGESDDRVESSVSPSVPSLPVLQQDTATPRHGSAEGRFIHAICGASFKTRFGVKKHHWGAALDDVNTTSGCWARNGKPNRAWDEDPSCAPDNPKPRTSKTRNKTSDNRAPVAPSMFSSSEHLLPGFPDLKGLPSTVAGLVNGAPAFSAHCGFPVPRPVASRDQQGMESLLSAVHVVSNEHAPQPPSTRNDSLFLTFESQGSPPADSGHLKYQSWTNMDDRPYTYSSSTPRSQALTEEQMRDVGMHMTQTENSAHPPLPSMVPSQRQCQEPSNHYPGGTPHMMAQCPSPMTNTEGAGIHEAPRLPSTSEASSKKSKKSAGATTTSRKRGRAPNKEKERPSESSEAPGPNMKKMKI